MLAANAEFYSELLVFKSEEGHERRFIDICACPRIMSKLKLVFCSGSAI
jgi:hypothetical protein